MDVNEELRKLDKRVTKIEENINTSIPEIKTGISEIKIMLQERPIQEDLKNKIIEKDVVNYGNRVKKIEDNLNWVWRTLAGTIFTTVAAAIVFAIKSM